MKKLFVLLTAMVVSLSAGAFDFDGINLNASVNKISAEIAKRGYSYDEATDAFTGMCQGTKIFLTMNWKDVKESGKLGQLIVEIPQEDANAVAAITKVFNVIYHVAGKGRSNTYTVSSDGTTVEVKSGAKGIILVYNTPYYKK